MFFFGSDNDTANLYQGVAFNVKGPALPDVSLDEMSEEDLKIALTYARIAYEKALEDGANQGTLDLLLHDHDEAFLALAEASEGFRENVRQNKHRVLNGYSKDNINKYKSMAGVLT